MITNKSIAEKINVTLNLIYHLQDYILNKDKREEQLHLTKNVVRVMEEIISSKIITNYFIKGIESKNEYEELLSEQVYKEKKLSQKEKDYIKRLISLGFNQKNLDILNLFYDGSCEMELFHDLIKYFKYIYI